MAQHVFGAALRAKGLDEQQVSIQDAVEVGAAFREGGFHQRGDARDGDVVKKGQGDGV